MSFHRTRHFDFVAIVRGDEVRTDKQKYNIVSVYVLVDFAIDLSTGRYPAVMPSFNHALALQHGQLSFELIAKFLILVGIGKEQAGQ